MENELQNTSEALSRLLKTMSGLVRGNVEEVSFRTDGVRVRLRPPWGNRHFRLAIYFH